MWRLRRGQWSMCALSRRRCAGKGANGVENERALWEHEREEFPAQAKDQVAAAADGLCALVQRFDIPLFLRKSGLVVLVDALRRQLEAETERRGV
jgi:hypothetical protein